MSDDNGWSGTAVMDPVQTPPVPRSEVARLAAVVDCMQAADDGERRRLLAYLVDRYGQTPGPGRRGR